MSSQFAVPASIEAALPIAVEEYSYPDTPNHADAKKLLAYWQDCMTAGGFVMGKDIPNRRIAGQLRNIIINEPLPDGSDLHVRLAGAMVRRRFNREIKGSRLSEMFPPDVFARHLKSSLDVMLRWTPIIVDARMMRGDLVEMRTNVILLPIRAPDLISTWLLVGLFFYD